MSRRLKKFDQFYLESKTLQHQHKKEIVKEREFQIFESKVQIGKKLDLVEVLIEREVYKTGTVNESISHYLYDENFKYQIKYDSCAGLISEGIKDLRNQTFKKLIKYKIPTSDLHFINKNFDYFLLGDKRIVEGLLGFLSSGVKSLFEPVVELILKPGWQALKKIGSKIFGEDIVNRIEKMGEDILNKISAKWSEIDDSFQNILDKTWSGIKSIGSKIGEFLKSFWEQIKKIFSWIWEQIKKLAKESLTKIANIKKVQDLVSMLTTQNESLIVEAEETNQKVEEEKPDQKSNKLVDECKIWGEHWMKLGKKMLFSEDSEDWKKEKNAAKTGIENLTSGTSKNEDKSTLNIDYAYYSLLTEIKTNRKFDVNELINQHEQKIQSIKESVDLEDMKKKGKAGELASKFYTQIEATSGLMSSNPQKCMNIISSIKDKCEEEKVDYKEVFMNIDELFKNLQSKKSKQGLSKWVSSNFEGSEFKIKILRYIKKLDSGVETDPIVLFDDVLLEQSAKFWDLVDDEEESEKLIKILNLFDKKQLELLNKQSKFKFAKQLTSYLRKKYGSDSDNNSEIQKYFVNKKKELELSDDFKVDALLKLDEKAQKFWSDFKEAFEDKDIQKVKKLLTNVLGLEGSEEMNPELLDQLDDICRQELKFSFKKSIEDKFSGMFSGKKTKAELKEIIASLDKPEFIKTKGKTEEAKEESGLIKKWIQNVVAYLISPLGFLMKKITSFIGQTITFIPSIFGAGLSWDSCSSTFTVLPAIFALLLAIAAESVGVTKKISSLLDKVRVPDDPHSLMLSFGAKVQKVALAAEKPGKEVLAKGAEVVKTYSKVDKQEKEEDDETDNQSFRYINTKFSDFITEEAESESGINFSAMASSVTIVGGSILMSYVIDIVKTSFPTVGLILTIISYIFVALGILNLLHDKCPRWFGSEDYTTKDGKKKTPPLKWLGKMGNSAMKLFD